MNTIRTSDVVDPSDHDRYNVLDEFKYLDEINSFHNQLYIQRKSHNVCYIQSCYIANTCTERVTHLRLSSGIHMHAWRAYFYNSQK